MFAARNVRDASNAHPIVLERVALTRVAFLHQFWLHRVRKCKGNRTTGREVRRSVQKGWIFYLVFIVIRGEFKRAGVDALDGDWNHVHGIAGRRAGIH